MIFKSVFTNIFLYKEWDARFARFLARNYGGVFLIHPLFVVIFWGILKDLVSVNIAVRILILEFGVLISSFLFSNYVLRKIPILIPLLGNQI